MTNPLRPPFRSRLATHRSRVIRRHAAARGQVLPVALMFMSIFLLFAWFLIDIAGVQSVAQRALTGALRGGGLAALQQRGTTDAYGRWYVCPFSSAGGCDGLDGDATARDFVAQNLLGDPALGSGGYTDIFGSRTDGIERLSSGTGGNGYGLDVEILDPAAQDGQIPSVAFLNRADEGSVPVNVGSFPECLESSLLPGTPFCTATVILHIRIPDRHVVGTFGTLDTIVVVKAGTDAN